MPFTVEPANSVDAHEIAKLLHRSIIELCTDDHAGDPGRYEPWLDNKTAENVDSWISGTGKCFTAIDENRKVLGVALGRLDGHVLLIYVLPEARFTGVSKALIRALESCFQDRGLDDIHVKSTATAERFFRSLGYSETGETDVQNYMTFHTFKKAI
ncbi:MAG: GNAT family N-acetyltransferase [Roseibium sp.]